MAMTLLAVKAVKKYMSNACLYSCFRKTAITKTLNLHLEKKKKKKKKKKKSKEAKTSSQQ
jgi:hypothetical protein